MVQSNVTFRPMAAADCAAVVALVHELAVDAGGRVVPALDEPRLKAISLGAAALVDTVVAASGADVLGACLGLMTYSTWRGAKGLYIVDLVVGRAHRSRGLGAALLRATAQRAMARGAEYVKLEVDTANPRAADFYRRLGFVPRAHDRLFALEGEGLASFAGAMP